MEDGTHVIKHLTGMLIPIFGILLPVALMWIAFRFRERRVRHTEETVRRLLEQGLAVPPELLRPVERAPDQHTQLRSGLILIGLGLGLTVFFLVVGAESMWGVGTIPGFIGVAQLIAWRIETRQAGATAPARPPAAPASPDA